MIDVAKIDVGPFKHWAFVSDRVCRGKPMLISNSWRNGTVQEEPWDQVVKDRSYRVTRVETQEPGYLILERARKAIDRVTYNFARYNCEHFIREVITGVARSEQVRGALALAGIAVIACSLASAHPYLKSVLRARISSY